MTIAPKSVEGGPLSAAAPHRATVPIVLCGVFLTSMDFFIVNAAIPSLQGQLRATDATIQLVVAGYSFSYGAGMITGGRLGDRFGRRRMFTLAVALFTLASAACGFAWNPGFLVAGRVLQGAAASLMAPQVLAIFNSVFSGEARARAMNWYGFTMVLGNVLGPLIGGLLIRGDVLGLGWRTCFLVNVPIGIVAVLLALRYVPESRAPRPIRLDLFGVALVSIALLAVLLPLVQGRQAGWPLWTWVLLIGSLPLFLLFGLYQRRVSARGGFPLVDLVLFRERAFSVGLIAQLVFWTGQASYYLLLALYLQVGRGVSPFDAGLLFGVIGLGALVTSTNARRLALRLGRQAIAVGGVLRIVGLSAQIAIVLATGNSGSVLWLIPALLVDGAGMGIVVAPLASTVLARVQPEHVGSASGVLTTGLQTGNGLGVAFVGLIFYPVLGSGGSAAYPHAFAFSLLYLLGVCVCLVVLVQLLPKHTTAEAPVRQVTDRLEEMSCD